MQIFFRLLGWVAALVLAVVLGFLYWVDDANRLKPELTALIEQQTEYEVTFNGDLSWQLFPPLILEIDDVSLTDGELTLDAQRLELQMDLSGLWEDVDRWQVKRLYLADALVSTETASTQLDELELSEFALNHPAPLTAAGIYQPNSDSPLPFTLSSTVTYSPATPDQPERIELGDAAFTSDIATGTCQMVLHENPDAPAELPTESPDELLPVATLLSYDMTAECALDSLTAGTETFYAARLDMTNANGTANIHFAVDDFLGGTLVTDIDIEADASPVRWTVIPEVTNVDSKRLLNWTSQNLNLIAFIGLNSQITMTGNTAPQLAQSVRATSEFDGGQGQLNIVKIKEQLARVALLTQRSEKVENWPDMWEYQHFTGRWNIEGPNQQLSFALDNMNVDATGTFDFLTDNIDMLAEVTIHETSQDSPFRVNETLQGTPIPIRCTGSAADPECRLDEHAARNLIARALRKDDDSGLRRKLEEKIDEKVPEEYRDTARELLDLIGRALDNR